MVRYNSLIVGIIVVRGVERRSADDQHEDAASRTILNTRGYNAAAIYAIKIFGLALVMSVFGTAAAVVVEGEWL